MNHGASKVSAWLVMLSLAGCTSVPKAPTVSANGRTPINAKAEVDLQSCRSDLNNTKLLLGETARLADSASTSLSQVTARCAVSRSMAAPYAQPAPQANAAPVATGPAQSWTGNTVFVLRFGFGSCEINLTDTSAIELSDAARTAQLIVIRGRTDGRTDTAGEARVAKARAEAVRSYLVAQGIDTARIRATYQATGDFIADNQTEAGRALNRRAEIEVYQTQPLHQTLALVEQ
jgi:outer membrane protein OmpA-like peptidoglycan-associated protein